MDQEIYYSNPGYFLRLERLSLSATGRRGYKPCPPVEHNYYLRPSQLS
jgi:hypothetical protein